jgi:hypothetical protein
MQRLRFSCGIIVLLLNCVVVLEAAESPKPTPRWSEILGPAKGTIPPAPSFKVEWRNDLQSALAEAKDKQRPLFVTLRCLPCKQCAEFDKEVLDGGSDLDPLLAQFITVRLTNAAAIDLRIFPVEGFQDLDLSWWGWFLSPEAQVYAIFGGKDHVSEKTRISKDALVSTVWRVLKHHYDPRRKEWDVDGPVPDLTGATGSLSTLPGWASWDGKRSKKERQGCVHCHNVNDILRQPAIDAHTSTKNGTLMSGRCRKTSGSNSTAITDCASKRFSPTVLPPMLASNLVTNSARRVGANSSVKPTSGARFIADLRVLADSSWHGCGKEKSSRPGCY